MLKNDPTLKPQGSLCVQSTGYPMGMAGCFAKELAGGAAARHSGPRQRAYTAPASTLYQCLAKVASRMNCHETRSGLLWPYGHVHPSLRSIRGDAGTLR